MIRSLTFITMATAATAFQPMAPLHSNAGNTALQVSTSLPHYADTTSVTLEKPLVEQSALVEDLSQEKETRAPKKKVIKKPAPKQPAHKEGLFSPMVMFVKGVLGDEKLNKVRGKVISAHSDVIKSFVDTSESAFGDAVLRSLFRLADKDGNGTIEEEELKTALHSLGFSWLQDKQVGGIFKRADLDENGAIDMDEWIKEAPKTLKTNLVKLAKKNGGDLGFLV